MVALNIDQLHAHAAALEDLDVWDDTLTALDVDYVDAARARDRLTEATDALAYIEAEMTLRTEGKNDTGRKARLTLALATHAGYQQVRAAQREAKLRLMDAERRIEVARQRARLLREAVHLGVAADHEQHDR